LTNLQNPGTDSGGCRNEDITCNIITSYFEHKVDASYTTVQKQSFDQKHLIKSFDQVFCFNIL